MAAAEALRPQGALWISSAQADLIFGLLGTHARCAGATLHLRDELFADRRGRRVAIAAPGRAAAAAALRAAFFHLSRAAEAACGAAAGGRCDLDAAAWSYDDGKGVRHGPFPAPKLVAWARRGAFGPAADALPLRHAALHCWVPLWALVEWEAAAAAGAGGAACADADAMEVDWEASVDAVNAARAGGALGGAAAAGAAAREAAAAEAAAELAELMDYDIAPPEEEGAGGPPARRDGLRAVLIVDTNILISRLATLERALDALGAEAGVEVALLVPWVVVNELDALKDCGREPTASAARRALGRLRALAAEREARVRLQPAAEHAAAAAAAALPDVGAPRLRNDDLILSTCLHYERGLAAVLRARGHAAAAVLLTNDRGLAARAGACGVAALSGDRLPRTAAALAAVVPRGEAAAMDAAGGPPPPPLSPESSAGAAPAAPDGLAAQLAALQVQRAAGMPPPVLSFERSNSVSSAAPPLAAASAAAAAAPAPLPPAADPADELAAIVERCLAPGVAHYRQQDLGDLWIEMLEDAARPPWDAPTTLCVVTAHKSSFWGVLNSESLARARTLEAFLRCGGRRRGAHFGAPQVAHDAAAAAAAAALALLRELASGLGRPRADGLPPPDPAEVPDFVSQGAARAALEEGAAAAEALLARL
jgi:hypothetical protein